MDYPVFFEAEELEVNEKNKIWRYFQKKRDSGGGDCRQVEKVGDKLYKISFSKAEDRERVLQRKSHTIALCSGELSLTVTGTGSPVDPTPDPQTQPAQAAKSPNATDVRLESTSPLDTYLLYYLRDCPRAFAILQRQFADIGGTLELDFQSETVTVRGETEKGPGGAFSVVPEKWQLQVNQILSLFQQTFSCYHAVEPRKAQAILHDNGLANEFVKVYCDLGYPVVVGKESTITEKIKLLERNIEPSVDGTAQELVEDNYTRVSRTEAVRSDNVPVLESSGAELHETLVKSNSLPRNIQKRNVQFPTQLQKFFTTSSAIGNYQTLFRQSLSSPVSLEAVRSHLILSSVSSVALEEAEVLLKRDLSFAVVELQGNAAKAPDLDRIRELLMTGQDDANVSECRVNVSLASLENGSAEIQLVGYSECVNRLKEELRDFQLNHISAQEALSLPSAEAVDCFSKILTVVSPKDSRVTLKASSTPSPHVLLSGPLSLVRETRAELEAELSSLTSDTLVLDGPGAREHFSAEGKASKELIETSNQVFIQELSEGGAEETPSVPNCVELPTADRINRAGPETSPSTQEQAVDVKPSLSKISLQIKLGNLVNEQVNVLVVPKLRKNLLSTELGKSLARRGGLQMKLKFTPLTMRPLSPGGVAEIAAPPSLGCNKLFFIECLPWNGFRSFQALSSGLQRCLELCAQQGYRSVAFPVIGPGTELKYPLREAVLVLCNTLKNFAIQTVASTVQTIRVVIKPVEDNAEEMVSEVHRQLIQTLNQEEPAIFRSVCSDLGDLSIAAGGGVQLQLIFGDITDERTDAVVNSTDFENFGYNGVCKAILAVAGPEVEAVLKSAKVENGEVLATQPGRFPCKVLLHVCGRGDAALVQRLMSSVVRDCEAHGWTSVAVPAICAGNGCLAPGVVAGAIFRGLAEAMSTPLLNLVKIRLVLRTIDAFLAFKEKAMQMFSTASIVKGHFSSSQHERRRVMRELRSLPKIPPVVCLPTPAPAPPVTSPPTHFDITKICTSSQKSVFKITGLSPSNIANAKKTMTDLYQSLCSSQTFKKEEFAALTPGDLLTLKQTVESLGLQVQCSQGDWTVRGLTAKVNQVIHLVHRFINETLSRGMRLKEEEDLFARVAWCIEGTSGKWERLPKAANYQLEHREAPAEIKDAHGQQWDVNLKNMEVTKKFSTLKATLKRLENLPDFTFPLYWDNMASDEILRVVSLPPSSAEYRAVTEGFQCTCPKPIIKIERVQNIHLRRSYEAQSKHISDKNRLIGGANERLLYHGTTRDNSKSIINMGFNSRFSGQNATSYGQGSYFAIQAHYSARPTYSKPGPDNTQVMFLARVLTGLHTQGAKEMRVPPPRDPSHPHDRFDSVVDNTEQPNMYVVFHDNQAYPDYLITFRST